MKRNVYLEATSAFQNPAKRMYIFTDVLAFTNPSFALDLPEYGIVQIVARVITADAPIKLRISPGGSTGCLVWIYASILDQAMTVEAGNSSTVLALGTGSDHVGVQLNVFPDTVRAKYETAYLKHKNADLQAHLETQLRVSLALFWRSTSIAVSLCSYVASVTSNPALYPQLNMQAIASGQQLAAKAMTGPDMSYAPILVLDSYKETVREALAATAGFERQYDRFMDQEAQLEIQKQAWDTMLQQAINERGMREVLRDSALSKYETACDTVTRCHSQLKTDEKELEPAKDAFLQGLEEWVDRQKLNGVFGILQGIIGRLASGKPHLDPYFVTSVE